MNPHEWIMLQHRREDRIRAGLAFVVIACVLVVLIGGGALLVALIEGRL